MSKEFQIRDGNLIASFDLENEDGDIDFCKLLKVSHDVAEEIGMFVDYVATNKIIKDQSKKISDLEAKLAECEKKAYSRGHSQRDIANEIKLNALREDVANKEKRIVELKQQLEKSEKSKESYRLQNEHHHLQLLQFYSRLGVEAFGADIHEKALETLMIMKEQLAEKEKEIQRTHNYYQAVRNRETIRESKISFAVEQLEKVKGLIANHTQELWTCENDDIDLVLYEEIDKQINELKGKAE